jgi:hypothetical protein
MANRFLRGLYTYDIPSGQWPLKALQFWLQYNCGLTNFAESVSGGGAGGLGGGKSFNSYEAWGNATGSFSGAVQPTGSITTDGNPNLPSDGDTLTIDDGLNDPVIFEFDDDSSYTGVPVDTTGSPSADTMRDRLITAVNGVEDLFITASNGGSGTVTLTHYYYTDRGNQTVTKDFSVGSWAVSGLTGGLDGWELTDSGTPFTVGSDEKKMVCIVDNTNTENMGVFIIRRVASTSKVELDFKANKNGGEAFTASSGVTWYMFSKSSDIPNTDGDYFTMRSAHASNWEVKIIRYNGYITFNVAVDGSWSGSKILGASAATDCAIDHTGLRNSELNGYCDTDGYGLYVWMYEVIPNTNGNPRVYTKGVFVSVVDPVEPETLDIEKVGLFGGTTGGSSYFMRYYGGSIFRRGFSDARFWNDSTQSEVRGHIVELGTTSSSNSLSQYQTPETNHRFAAEGETVGKSDSRKQNLVVLDANNQDGDVVYLGWVTTHYNTFAWNLYGTNPADPGGSDKPFRRNLPFTLSTSKDLMYITGGLVLPAPGLTPMFP